MAQFTRLIVFLAAVLAFGFATPAWAQKGTIKIESFGMYGYDATMVGVKALEEWIKANGGKRPSRAEVFATVRNIKNFKGVTGAIQFYQKGDPVKAKYFVLQFDKQAYPGKVVKVIEQQAPAAAKKP